MGGNSINLFKYRFLNGPTEAYNGYAGWGDYAELLQDMSGEFLVWELTEYDYDNEYLTVLSEL